MENLIKELTEIKGWGVDADPKNDPTYPIRHRREDGHNGYNWERPTQQVMKVEILHSNERPTVTAVFGTSVPPKGLSGMIRRYAFKYSEGSFVHWLPLIFADRINVVEGIIDDFRKGKIPNLFAEKGGKASWKYNKKKIILNMLTGVVVTSAVLGLIFRKNISLRKFNLEDSLPG